MGQTAKWDFMFSTVLDYSAQLLVKKKKSKLIKEKLMLLHGSSVDFPLRGVIHERTIFAMNKKSARFEVFAHPV